MAGPIPQCINWSVEEVAKWIGDMGFKEYKECFSSNFICGRKLIQVDASSLPNMGITDWIHVKLISAEIRKLLKIEDPYWNRSITLPRRSELGMYLEQKSFTGHKADTLALNKNITSE